MKEDKTTYSEALKYIVGKDNPTFELIRDVATAILQKQPSQVQQDAYDSLEHGTAILFHGLQMDAYLKAYGRMHQAKLNYAYKHISETFLAQNEINIIDYGCGLGVGIMCFADFLRKQGFVLKVNTITLVEPSVPTLKRAALHSRLFFPNANINTIDKDFDQLSEEDIVCKDDIPTLHILSNVLDLDFDFERFSLLIRDCLKGYNQFVCTGPYFYDYEKDERMELFADKLMGNNVVYDKNDELDPDEDWTCAICCFNAGDETKNENLNAGNLILYPIKNWYQSEKVVLYPFNDYDDFKRQFNQGEKIKYFQNSEGVLVSFSMVKNTREAITFFEIPVGEACEINLPLHLEVVSINNAYYYFLDNQWEIDMLIKMDPSLKREQLIATSEYYKIIDLNVFIRESNDNQPIEFQSNRFGFLEAIYSLIINGKKESVKMFIRPSCNTSKPMNIRIVKTNYNDNQYYAFIDNQWKYRHEFNSILSHHQQYIRLGKKLKQKTHYKVGVFDYEYFERVFNNGEKFEWEKLPNNSWVSYADLSLNSNENVDLLNGIIATLYINENIDPENNLIIELFHDTYSGKKTGTLKNFDDIIEL